MSTQVFLLSPEEGGAPLSESGAPGAAETREAPDVESDFLSTKPKSEPGRNHPRFRQVYAQKQALESENLALKERIAQIERDNQSPNRKTSVSLETEIKKTFEGSELNSDRVAVNLSRLIEQKVNEAVETHTQRFTQEQQMEQARRAHREQALQALGEYDEESRKSIIDLARSKYESDPFLQASPSGEYDAVVRAERDILRGKVPKGEAAQAKLKAQESLSVRTRSAVQTQERTDRTDDLKSVINAPTWDKVDATAAYLRKHPPHRQTS